MARRNGKRPVPMITPEAAEQRKLEKLLREGGTRWCEGCQQTEDFCFNCSVEKNEPVFHPQE